MWGTALIAGAILRLLLFHLRPSVSGDALMYGDLAQNVVAHHVYGFSKFSWVVSGDVVRPTLIRLPGYPLFLAICFVLFGSANYLAAIWVQMAIDLGACALLGVLAARLAGRRAGVATVWLAALCPFTANYSVVVLAETLSVFCVVLAYFSLERWDRGWRAGRRGIGWAALTGCALCFAVQLRPDQGLLAAAVVPVMVWMGVRHGWQKIVSRLLPAGVASLLVLLPLVMWTGRNWKTFHVIQPLVPRYANDPGEFVSYGFQRWYRTWAVEYKSTFDVYWSYDGDRLKLGDLPRRAFDNAEQLAQTRALYGEYNKKPVATETFDREFAQIADERIADHPLRYYVAMPIARELDMWLRPRTELTTLPIAWWDVRAHPWRSIAEIAYGLLDIAYLAFAVAGIFYLRRQAWRGGGAVAFAMLAFVVLRCLLLLTLDNSEPRYTLECFPVVILLGGFAMAKVRAIGDSVQ